MFDPRIDPLLGDEPVELMTFHTAVAIADARALLRRTRQRVEVIPPSDPRYCRTFARFVVGDAG